MENTSTSQGSNGEEIRGLRPYNTPQLTSLGEIQSIIQASSGTGLDGSGTNTIAAVS
jgi:hypothetical protein